MTITSSKFSNGHESNARKSKRQNRCAQAYRMHVNNGLTFAAIATGMGVKPPSVVLMIETHRRMLSRNAPTERTGRV